MASLTRWDPFTDLRTTMDRLFDEGFSRPWRMLPSNEHYDASFPVEVSETDNEIEVKASLPGVKPEEVDVTVQNDVLTIKAEHKDTAEEKKRDYYRREIRYGSFQRSLSLPISVDSDKAEATFENGELYLRLPKAEAVKAKQIKVGSGSGAPAIES
ncbi:MAG TPA: Hsp20/alpha crystallin family protein [Dehalococcoidia bacterium]|nr:Hsp20/alpha crystallin family protein [Dehalococcoidia bacterium]